MDANDKQSPLRFPIPATTLAEPHCTLTTERKSRFLSQCCHCGSADEARDFVARIRQRNPDATHNCWAFVAGPPGDTARIGSSDDGEPHGTAGMPMLRALLHAGIGEICIVVSRWFGGIKLGTGGLARAYQEAVLRNLESLPLVELTPTVSLRLFLDYAVLDGVKKILDQFGAKLESGEYHANVELLVSVPQDMAEDFKKAVANACGGRVRMEGC